MVKRIETGVLQFGEDHPGVFVRGDNAIYYGHLLQAVLRGEKLSPIEALNLQELFGLLNSCDTNRFPEEPKTKIKDWSLE